MATAEKADHLMTSQDRTKTQVVKTDATQPVVNLAVQRTLETMVVMTIPAVANLATPTPVAAVMTRAAMGLVAMTTLAGMVAMAPEEMEAEAATVLAEMVGEVGIVPEATPAATGSKCIQAFNLELPWLPGQF